MQTELAAWIASGAAVASAIAVAMITWRMQVRLKAMEGATARDLAALNARLTRDLERARALQPSQLEVGKRLWTALSNLHVRSQAYSADYLVTEQQQVREIHLSHFDQALDRLEKAQREAELILPPSAYKPITVLWEHFMCIRGFMADWAEAGSDEAKSREALAALCEEYDAAELLRPEALAAVQQMIGAQPSLPAKASDSL